MMCKKDCRLVKIRVWPIAAHIHIAEPSGRQDSRWGAGGRTVHDQNNANKCLLCDCRRALFAQLECRMTRSEHDSVQVDIAGKSAAELLCLSALLINRLNSPGVCHMTALSQPVKALHHQQ